MISDLYVKLAINNMKKRLKVGGLGYLKNISDIKYLPQNPYSSVEYSTELVTSM